VAEQVTAGLAENNGGLPPADDLKIHLQACTLGSASDQVKYGYQVCFI